MRIINRTNTTIEYSRLSPTVGSGIIPAGGQKDLDLPDGSYTFGLIPQEGALVVENAGANSTVELVVKVS